MELERFQTCS